MVANGSVSLGLTLYSRRKEGGRTMSLLIASSAILFWRKYPSWDFIYILIGRFWITGPFLAGILDIFTSSWLHSCPKQNGGSVRKEVRMNTGSSRCSSCSHSNMVLQWAIKCSILAVTDSSWYMLSISHLYLNLKRLILLDFVVEGQAYSLFPDFRYYE